MWIIPIPELSALDDLDVNSTLISSGWDHDASDCLSQHCSSCSPNSSSTFCLSVLGIISLCLTISSGQKLDQARQALEDHPINSPFRSFSLQIVCTCGPVVGKWWLNMDRLKWMFGPTVKGLALSVTVDSRIFCMSSHPPDRLLLPLLNMISNCLAEQKNLTVLHLASATSQSKFFITCHCKNTED